VRCEISSLVHPVLNVAALTKATGCSIGDPVWDNGAPHIVSEWLGSRIASSWVLWEGASRGPESPESGTSADQVAELHSGFTTRSSRLFIPAQAQIFGDPNTSHKIRALFQAIASVRPCTFQSGFQAGQAHPISIPADCLTISWVPLSTCRMWPPLMSTSHCSWKKAFYSSMWVDIICAYDFVCMISLCVWFFAYDLFLWTQRMIWRVIKEQKRKNGATMMTNLLFGIGQ